MIIIPIEEAITADNFSEAEYEEKLIEEGYTPEAAKEKAEKRKASLQKSESDFEYVMKLEEIGKTNDHIIVAGYASSGSLDHDAEAINQDSLRTAFSEYMKNPVLRYMHGKDQRNPDAIGRVIPEYTDSNDKTHKTEFRDGKPFIVAEISNAPDVESIRTKIQEGVLTGFSVGGRAKRVAEFCTKLNKNINRIFVNRLSEISVVDLPANKETFFEVIKNECIGNNCSCDIYDNNEIINYDGVNSPENDNRELENLDKTETELEDNMPENIEMEMSELKEFVKSTVSDMITDQDTLEKVEGYDAAVKAAQDLRARIAELEAKVESMAAQLKAAPQEAMKAEKEPEPVEETDEEKKKREAKEAEDDRVGKLEAEIKELKESPLYKAEQNETVEKEETVEPVSHLGSIIKAHYGGN